MFKNKMSNPAGLPIPDQVLADITAVELIRAWETNDGQCMSIRKGFIDDPAQWGIILVDLARLIADSYENRQFDNMSALDRIKEGFDVEWAHPSE